VVRWSGEMTSKSVYNIRLAMLGALFAAAPVFADSSATAELRQLVRSSRELQSSFGASTVYAASSQRAEASATVGASRHAVVLYKSSLKSGIGEYFCHVALGGPERASWLSQLSTLPDSDSSVAEVVASERSVKATMRRVEYHSIKSPSGWVAGVCAVKLTDISTTYPALPDQASVRSASYLLGKQLFTTRQTNQALDRFKSLRLDSKHYPNALLYIVAILDQDNRPIADALRSDHLDLSKATDPDALRAYALSSAARAAYSAANAAGRRCTELGSECYEAPIKQ
jgi:hypothetical protein